MQEVWRWFGPDDPVALDHVRQAGALVVVTALHEVCRGEVWTRDRIEARKALIETAGFAWSVVESIPVHPSIKLGAKGADAHTDARPRCGTLRPPQGAG